MQPAERDDPIILPDGTALDERQTLALMLHVEGSTPRAQIAKRAGYSSAATLSTFLRSEKGVMGVQAAANRLFGSLVSEALQAQAKLMRSAKSELVRSDAAERILSRAERLGLLGGSDGSASPAGRGSVNIQINVPGLGAEAKLAEAGPVHERTVADVQLCTDAEVKDG